MKIFIQAKVIKQQDLNTIKATFPDITFTDDEKDCDIEVAICYPSFITDEKLQCYHHLKWVQLLSAGFDTIDEEIIKKQEILFTNAKGIYSQTIAEDVICRILMINRNVKRYLEQMKNHEWKPLHQEYELAGSTAGIIGVGSIGKEIAKRLQAFSVRTIGFRRNYESEPYFDEIFVGEDGLETVLKTSDYLILALPLNQESYHLINEKTLKLMKKEAVLINIARGDIINQDDLINALENKQIRAASLDVFAKEPLPADHKLWTLDNVYLTPHNSGSGPYISQRLTELIIENIKYYLHKEKLINIISV